MTPLPFIDQRHVYYHIQQRCQVLNMTPNRCYVYQHTQAAETSEPTWETEILAVFEHRKRRYSTRRLHVRIAEKRPSGGPAYPIQTSQIGVSNITYFSLVNDTQAY